MSAHLTWHGEEVTRLIEEAASKGLGDAADKVGETSDQRVPVRTGELERSRKVLKEPLRAVIGYTDSKAAAAHENLHARRYRNGRRAKFLESAADDHRQDIERMVAEEIRRVL